MLQDIGNLQYTSNINCCSIDFKLSLGFCMGIAIAKTIDISEYHSVLHIRIFFIDVSDATLSPDQFKPILVNVKM